MDRLILFRHGKAEPESASGEDFDRRLSPRGVRESVQMGAHLADLGFAPDLVLVSPSARTRETWAAAEPHFPKAQARFDDELYHADSGAVRHEAERAGGTCGTVMVVGHNPGLQELAVRLLMEGSAPSSLIARAQRHFPTAAAAVFLIDDNGRPAFDGLFFPERDSGRGD
ncbi:MAG: sixA [Phenylobacterium sp.]|jgi:phosphohistidine phosphatase|uniref:SixA phosphatase family protein n=1 Tax=Phenylobacterium sp. TaxID=1871053 RepID=UPI002632E60B|nr:histidine phosphatase family protein [Phenylobacterium sp.]MDB5426461.1 sixA [Phenylobacterium sp.]MDB5435499.1 sixA [Phenylobacterium sp.]MDB5498692.1 sixA [Phenylobacterium sp.]